MQKKTDFRIHGLKSRGGLVRVENALQDPRIVFLRHPGAEHSEPDEQFSVFVLCAKQWMVNPEGELVALDEKGNTLVAFSRLSWIKGGAAGPTPPQMRA